MEQIKMLGALAGDIIGSAYEFEYREEGKNKSNPDQCFERCDAFSYN